MPLAAIIEDKVICLHGGIGVYIIYLKETLRFVEDIDTLVRPLTVIHEV